MYSLYNLYILYIVLYTNIINIYIWRRAISFSFTFRMKTVRCHKNMKAHDAHMMAHAAHMIAHDCTLLHIIAHDEAGTWRTHDGTCVRHVSVMFRHVSTMCPSCVRHVSIMFRHVSTGCDSFPQLTEGHPTRGLRKITRRFATRGF